MPQSEQRLDFVFPAPGSGLGDALVRMEAEYRADPRAAVRSQRFIRMLHGWIAKDLRGRLTKKAIRDGVQVIEEATIYGSHKPKDADVAVIHPTSGPLMYVGVRSQMSSVSKNVLTYYQDIVGEVMSLQERFPMTVYGYAYLHPLKAANEKIDHQRYARMYEAIAGRGQDVYREVRGRYDEFAYLVVDFHQHPEPALRDDLVLDAVPLERKDLRIASFVDRLVTTFSERHIWMDYFEPVGD